MKQLDKELDDKPTAKKVSELAETRIRNLQAFNELQSFNDHSVFKYEHPLIINKSEKALLEQLYSNNPSEFLRQYKCASDNIRRYRGYLKSTKRTNKRSSDRELLKKHLDRETLFTTIINNHNEKNTSI